MLPRPHGGKLVKIQSNHSSDSTNGEAMLEISYESAVTVTDLKNGILSPLDGFTSRNDYDSILREQRLENGLPWSIPVMLTIGRDLSKNFRAGDRVTLTLNSNPLAELQISELFEYNRKEYASRVFGTTSPEHPGVIKIINSGDIAISGRLVSASDIGIPFRGETLFPEETRRIFSDRGWKTVSAFQTRNVPHRGHEQIQRLSLRETDGLFINPVIGRKKQGDYTDEAIMRAYSALVSYYYPPERVVLTPLHYEMMYAGPREAVMHAIMRKNYGCTHFIVGRDHAGVGTFYGPYDAQKNLATFDDLGITIVPFEETFYCRKCEQLVTDRECPHSSDQERFSGTMIREIIRSANLPPPQVMRLEVYRVIKEMENPFVK